MRADQIRTAIAPALALALLPVLAAGPGLADPSALTQAEKDAFRDTVAACWVAPDSMATVTVAFRLDPQGLPDPDSFRVVGASNPALEPALMAARRAVMRCAGAGYALPAARYDEWSEVEMTFAASGVELTG